MTRQLLLLICYCIINDVSAQHDEQQWKKMRTLDFLVGQWEVETESRLSLNGPWEKTRGESRFQLTLDSTLLEESYKGSRQGKPFLSKTFFAVENMYYKFQRTFIDAPHGVMVDYSGESQNDSLIFDKHFVYKNGNSVELRVVYKKISNDHFVLESMRMPAGATGWDINGRMKYTRITSTKK